MQQDAQRGSVPSPFFFLDPPPSLLSPLAAAPHHPLLRNVPLRHNLPLREYVRRQTCEALNEHDSCLG